MRRKARFPRKRLAEFCRRHHIRKLSLFGSALRGNLGKGSDVDMLVEFFPRKGPGYIGLAGMELELARMVGRKIDLRTPQELSRHFRDIILSEARTHYVHR